MWRGRSTAGSSPNISAFHGWATPNTYAAQRLSAFGGALWYAGPALGSTWTWAPSARRESMNAAGGRPMSYGLQTRRT